MAWQRKLSDYLERLKGKEIDPELACLRFLVEDILSLRYHPFMGGFYFYSKQLGKYLTSNEVAFIINAVLKEYANPETIEVMNSSELERRKQDQSSNNSLQEQASSGYIYLLYGGGYYKIGMSANVNNRLTQISPRLPFEVELIHVFPVEDMISTESQLHDMFADKRTNGEWFELNEADIEYIKSIGELYG